MSSVWIFHIAHQEGSNKKATPKLRVARIRLSFSERQFRTSNSVCHCQGTVAISLGCRVSDRARPLLMLALRVSTLNRDRQATTELRDAPGMC